MLDIITEKQELLDFFKVLEKRNAKDTGVYRERVDSILKDIKEKGDQALLDYTTRFDGYVATLDNIRLTRETLKVYYERVDKKTLALLEHSAARIRRYQEKLLPQSWLEQFEEGEFMGQKVTPLESVGLYVPGGKAAYPSSVLMSAVPAKVAGVKRIVMASPCPKGEINPVVMAAAYIAGVDEVLTIGGAQAIGALAYGTQTIKPVDKIVGPGNIYVALAKQAVFGTTGIDSIAGPSEILVIADNTQDANAIACDLLAQAEHDQLASAILMTNDVNFGKAVQEKALEKYATAKRQAILAGSLRDFSRIIIVDDLTQACELANKIAPEHLELAVKEPQLYLEYIHNAGAIFMGGNSPEALGDYMAGPDHILPTARTARFFSPLSSEDFVKKSSLIRFDKEALARLKDEIGEFAGLEGLEMHGRSVTERF